ncbi:MAG: ATP-binding cassette domain-containing protein [Verrucomicrobiales bacterium]
MDAAQKAGMKLELRHIQLPLRSFSLQIDAALEHGIVSLFGPSGAGKTTLIELIAGLRKPAGGEMVLDGITLAAPRQNIWMPPQQRRIGYLPQDLCLFPHLTVIENILFADKAASKTADPTNFHHLDHLVQTLEIAPLLQRMPSQISGGEKQRVALARALRMKPRLLLLDEPFASLDQPLRKRLVPFLRRMREVFHVPIIYVSHDADEVADLSDAICVMEQGRFVAQGTPEQVFCKVASVKHFYPPRQG